MTSPIPVLIVGAGSAGLTLAIALQACGIPARIVDNNKSLDKRNRIVAVQRETQQALAAIGVLHDIPPITNAPLGVALCGRPEDGFAKTPVQSPEVEKDNGSGFPRAMYTTQYYLETTLLKHATIERGVSVIAFSQEREYVRVRLLRDSGRVEEVHCEWLVGADDDKGSVRKLAGISLKQGEQQCERLLLSTVEVSGIDINRWNTFGDPDDVLINLQPFHPSPLFQLQFQGRGLPNVLPRDTIGIQNLFNQISGRTDIAFMNAAMISEHWTNIGMAEQFVNKRVILIGDSAYHAPCSDAQGINSGIHDAFNLAWKLALVINHLAPPDLVESYEAERMPVIAEMLGLMCPRRLSPYEPSHSGRSTQATANFLLQQEYNYRTSSIVSDDRDMEESQSLIEAHEMARSRVRAGDRAPDAPGLVFTSGYILPSTVKPTTRGSNHDEKRLFELFATYAGLHVILVFPVFPAEDDLPGKIAQLEKHTLRGVAATVVVLQSSTDARRVDEIGEVSVIDRDGHAWEEYGLIGAEETMCVVVRPDGMIGCFAVEIPSVQRYFAEILCF